MCADQETALKNTLESLLQQYNLPAIGVSIDTNGKTITSVAGVKKYGSDGSVSTNSLFHMGSCGKALTAQLMHILSDKKLFGLNNTLQDIFPKLSLLPTYQNITLQELLTHTSGIKPDYEDLIKLHTLSQSQSPSTIREMIFQETITCSDTAPLDKRFSYSNLGYVILGAIAEKITGTSYEDLIQKHIFNPLGMNSCVFHTQSDQQLWGHRHDDDGTFSLSLNDNPTAYAPAGTVSSSLSDWMIFLKHVSKNNLDGYQVQIEKDVFYTHTAFIKDHETCSHDGNNTLNLARMIVSQQRNIHCVIACNDGSHHALQAINDLTQSLLKNPPFLRPANKPFI